MVARDGIEPPTPAFSGPRSTTELSGLGVELQEGTTAAARAENLLGSAALYAVYQCLSNLPNFVAQACLKLHPIWPTLQVERGNAMTQSEDVQGKIQKTEEEWRAQLSPEQFQVTRQKGTEPPFSGALYRNHADGTYHCVCCDAELFASDTKFESGSGWPSFWKPADSIAVATHEDISHGMRRVETTCARCGAHLGHVFEDGPKPTGLR